MANPGLSLPPIATDIQPAFLARLPYPAAQAGPL